MQKKGIFLSIIAAAVLITAASIAISQVSINKAPVRPVSQITSLPSGGCGQGSTCSLSAAGSCCSGPTSTSVKKPQEMMQALEGYLYRLYVKKLKDPQIQVEVKDFGCHMEATIRKDGSIIKRLSISGREISEIG